MWWEMLRNEDVKGKNEIGSIKREINSFNVWSKDKKINIIPINKKDCNSTYNFLYEREQI